ncbi:MAG: hypothetical protein IJ889_00555 [Eubacterium sp.]|nr:hypothetical protein [Eubacterium sp.]MBR2247449.1 hypothetical protein [Bacilli bacterium]
MFKFKTPFNFKELFAPKNPGVKSWDLLGSTPAIVIKNDDAGFSIVVDALGGLRMNLETDRDFKDSMKNYDAFGDCVYYDGNLEGAFKYLAPYYPDKIKLNSNVY